MSIPVVRVYIPYELSDLQRQALYVWLETIGSWVEKRRPFARRNQRHHDRVRDQRELLILRLQLWRDELADGQLQHELDALIRTVQQKLHQYWEVGVTDGRQLEAEAITNAVRKFGVDLQAFEPLRWDNDATDTQELRSLVAALGALPRHRIEITGFGEKIEDHVLAAHMAAEAARQFQGWVQLRVKPQFFTLRGEQAWTADDTRSLVTSLEGLAHEIRYDVGRDGSPRFYHLVDETFVRSWVEHDRFWLHG